MTALRIALIAHNHFPICQPFAGGLEAHVWHLTRALVLDGHRVTLFAAGGSDLALDHPGLTVNALRLSEQAARPFPPPGASKESDHHAYLDLMRDLIGPHKTRFDVIHNHSLHHVPIMLAPHLSTPMVTTFHTPPFPWLEAAIGATGGAGTTFAAVSRHTADAWRHVAADRLTLVPNGVDLDRWPAGPGGDDLVWSGRITPEKGPHLAIAAAQRAGRRLVLAGPIGNVEYFRHRIQPMLGERTSYAGHLDQRSLAALLGGGAAALVTPMWEEPYCLAAAEALACGTPVVAFARGGIPEIVDARCGRLVTAGDVDAMAAAIPGAVRLSRADVRAHAVTNLGARAMVASYVATYRTLIDGRNEPHRSPAWPGAYLSSDEELRTPA